MVYYRIQEIVQTVALRDVDWFWLGAVALGQHLAVFDLQGRENVLSEELLLFDIELLITTPTNRFRVKRLPIIMKTTKNIWWAG